MIEDIFEVCCCFMSSACRTLHPTSICRPTGAAKEKQRTCVSARITRFGCADPTRLRQDRHAHGRSAEDRAEDYVPFAPPDTLASALAGQLPMAWPLRYVDDSRPLCDSKEPRRSRKLNHVARHCKH